MKTTSSLAVLTAGLAWVAGAAARDARYQSAHSNGTAPVDVQSLDRRHEAFLFHPTSHTNVTENIRQKRGTCPASQLNRRHRSTAKRVKRQAGAGKVNAAYFTNWGVYERKYFPNDIPVQQLTHVNYAFATIEPSTGKAVLSDYYADQDMRYPNDASSSGGSGKNLYGAFNQFLALKKSNRHLKLVLSIGGWSYSPLFAPMATDSTKRAAFVSSAVDLVRNYGLDGLDIDWEFPNSAAEAAAYVSLLKELRAGLDAYAARVGHSNPYLLTIAAPCGPDNYGTLDMAGMDKYLSYWNLMGYDYSGEWSDAATHQANLLGAAPSDSDCITAYLSRGATASKVVLGMPIYGRGFDKTDGLNKPFTGVGYGTFGGGVYDYYALPEAGATEFYDAKAGAAWSYDSAKRRLISYDTPAVVQQKVDYLLSKGLAGSMFWELSGDNAGVASRSLVLASANRLGGLDQTPNHISYPESSFDNVRGSNPPTPPPTTTTSTTTTSTSRPSSTSTTSTSTSTQPGPTTTAAPSRQPIGSDCSGNSDCQSSSCVSNKCVPRPGQGWLGGFCNLSSQCGTSQHCFNNKCRDKKDYGASCTVDDTCRSGRCSPLLRRCIPQAGANAWVGAFCSNNSQCATGLCTDNACADKRQPGDDCSADVNCQSNRCDPAAKKCVPQSDGSGWIGSFCTANDQCSNGLCSSNACSAKVQLGEACANDEGCASGRCSPQLKRCIPPAGSFSGYVGVFCTNDSQCANRLCLDNACSDKAQLGGACTEDTGCASGRCSPQLKRCIPQAGSFSGYVGAFCTNNSQCVNNLCNIAEHACADKVQLGQACTDNVQCQSNRCSVDAQRCIPTKGAGWIGAFCTRSTQCQSSNCAANKCV
ncbi:uncharacterized protein PFL1_04340 [Pseudozyma flocculosa PF-1]|uniref:chitinase n=2 Tax=Pseudozyma flocculosa TaxID=84751 RepID=A0A5C3FAW0_9BASI|nr:uncharacterized protein PFL1_04340 [Pseudozyma flocculosa PF-1]EPQ28013.1 hypothetical protein PFL1_04340 [Pseudozyma flocculosa PF-1]SPO41594.1 uncharacterized protein PSFLO_07076 [Pseudozyma flocculosa]